MWRATFRPISACRASLPSPSSGLASSGLASSGPAGSSLSGSSLAGSSLSGSSLAQKARCAFNSEMIEKCRRLWLARSWTSLAVVWVTLAGGTACIPKKDSRTTSASSSSLSSATPNAGPGPGASGFDHSLALSLPSLAETFAPYFPVGAAIEPYQVTQVGDILVKHFNRLTTENAMKFAPLCPTPRCNFTQADTIANFAREHHMPMTGHALVWHDMVPGWIFRDENVEAKPKLVADRLKAHIFQMVERYADVVDNWDVVNEAISDQAGKVYRDGAERSKWYTAFGDESYIRLAFELAHAAALAHDPTVKLYYNDYNVEKPEKRAKILQMVRELRKAGVRVDGVGIQGHWGIAWPKVEEIEATILELRAENLEVKVSELDVSVYADDDHEQKIWQAAMPDSPELEQRLAERYREIFEVLKRNKANLAHVTFWGVSDDHTWLNYWPLRRDNYPLLFDRSHQPKPALRAILGLK
jgi:endo-1,4-beta-xylanase